MAIDDDTESCGSREITAAESSPAVMAPRAAKHQMWKHDVYNDVLRRLQEGEFEEASVIGFEDQLWQHVNRLPASYALDVNVERAEDVLMHMRFLRQAQDPANRPVFEVRLVQVNPISNSSPSDSVDSFSSGNDGSHRSIKKSRSLSLHPPPILGLSQNTDFDIGRAMHEITFSTVDKPKLLTQLTSLLSDIGLRILEVHAFSTVDGFSLDVFVVDGWPIEETEQLRILLDKELRKTKKLTQLKQSTSVDKECNEGLQNLTDVGNRSKSKGDSLELTLVPTTATPHPPPAANVGLDVQSFSTDPASRQQPKTQSKRSFEDESIVNSLSFYTAVSSHHSDLEYSFETAASSRHSTGSFFTDSIPEIEMGTESQAETETRDLRMRFASRFWGVGASGNGSFSVLKQQILDTMVESVVSGIVQECMRRCFDCL